MRDVNNLLFLLALLALIGLWLKASAARERATLEARAQCERHGVQLLDETVGLRALRLRRVDGWLRLERCYGFEVSVDGADRAPGQLWMLGHALIELHMPTVTRAPAAPPVVAVASGTDGQPLLSRESTTSDAPHEPSSNVVPFRPRPGSGNRLH